MFCYNTWLGDFMEYLDLPLIGKRNLSINARYFSDIKDELEEFLVDEDEINSRKFVKKIMFNQEIKSNNTIEGINDDLMLIGEPIEPKQDTFIVEDIMALCTPNEKKILMLKLQGYKNEEIGIKLHCSISKINNYMQSIRAKTREFGYEQQR